MKPDQFPASSAMPPLWDPSYRKRPAPAPLVELEPAVRTAIGDIVLYELDRLEQRLAALEEFARAYGIDLRDPSLRVRLKTMPRIELRT